MAKLSLPPDDYSLLHKMSSQELRLPEQMVRWLIRQEALRRGLAAETQQPMENSKIAGRGLSNLDGDFAGVINP